MNRLETALKIAQTNWIILATYFIGYWLYSFFNGIISILIYSESELYSLFGLIFGPAVLQLVYLFWVGYLVHTFASGITDTMLYLLNQNYRYTIYKMFINILIIYSLMIYTHYEDNHVSFIDTSILLLLLFSLAQALRYKRIQKILGSSEKIPKWHYVLLLSPIIIALLLWSYITLKDITYVYPKPNIVTINGVMYQNHQFNQDMNWTQASSSYPNGEMPVNYSRRFNFLIAGKM